MPYDKALMDGQDTKYGHRIELGFTCAGTSGSQYCSPTNFLRRLLQVAAATRKTPENGIFRPALSVIVNVIGREVRIETGFG